MIEEKQTDIRSLTIHWNNIFALDYWYRKKYNIPFNSREHRETEPISIMIEWEEEQIGTVLRNIEIKRSHEKDYKKTGGWLLEKESEDVEDFFDNLDESFFEAFDDKE